MLPPLDISNSYCHIDLCHSKLPIFFMRTPMINSDTQTKIPATSLEAELKKRNTQGDLQVQIMADEKVEYREVAKAMAQIQRSGVTKFTFVMLPDSATPAAK